MVERSDARSIVPTYDRGAIVESRLTERGLELVSNLEFTSIIPAAILVHNERLLIVEDAAFRQDFNETYWDDERPREFAVHQYFLDRHEYICTRNYSLVALDAHIANRKFVIIEDHLIVLERYNRHRAKPFAFEDIDWVEHVFTLEGELVTVLSQDQILLKTCWQSHINARFVKRDDHRIQPSWSGCISRAPWDSPYSTDPRELFRALRDNPGAKELNETTTPPTEHIVSKATVYPDLAFWELSYPCQVSAAKGNLHLSVEYSDILDPDMKSEWSRDRIQGDSEILVTRVESHTGDGTGFLTYFTIENCQIEAFHFLQPEQEIEKLNRKGSVNFTLRDIIHDSVIHHGILYIICEEEYSQTSVIMAFDVHTSTVTPILPQVPKYMSVVHRHT